ncbi:rhoGEF domain-containing protein [Hirsutella rhossiliensis]|uniref:RhoGEF domain-containing protein n=1 Tax=Hirsutella rhossiliensis TaxID=111463 RepID=A0A9P8SJB6_9HYPO|nr:rhoGEF domain-containing protein [Hirsutella rhossiliensis]KAH0962886.1 rhoGEF domain-containing protein [Hirsutella rhossiliensis]
MVRVTDDLALSPESVTLYHASDSLLGQLPVLVFHGPSTTANYTLNSSRVQIHVFSPVGFQSFPRITISPSSAFYGVVNHLPREFQGDEVYRALAFGLFKYFSELPDAVKAHLRTWCPARGKRPSSAPELFGEQHAADLVKSMVRSESTATVIAALHEALQTQHLSNVDLDLVLPPGAIVALQPADLEDVPDDEDDILDPTLRQYGGYTPLVRLFGEPVFLPTSKLRRAPSKPTALNRSKSFSRDQKVELRMKLAELVDTEERYVAKLSELVHHVAGDFRESAKKRLSGSLSPSEEELERLFPPSADEILRVNSAFLDQLKAIMNETEDEAFKDMESLTSNLVVPKAGGSIRVKDSSGALAMARLFLDWFPRFTECYQDYIRASQHFPSLLNSFLDQQSSFKQRVNQAGEQTIRSILIEPVQRLPRYSLLIDQIVNSLPMVHPALQPMLKARDIITNICSMDDPLPDKPHVAGRLRNMIESWPVDFEPQGRLILAADFIEMTPPFVSSPGELDTAGALLLFSDCIVVLKKTGTSMSGRDLLREIDKPSAAELLISMTNAAGGTSSYEFAFTGWHSLADVRFTESSNGSTVWMTSTQSMEGWDAGEHKTSKWPTSRCFLLQEAFEGKAAKWTEDVVKARVEARFSEREREDPCWSLRSVRMQDSDLGLHVAVFQEAAHELVEGRREPAPIRVVVDHEKGTKGAPVGHYGVEIVVNVSSKNMKRVSILTVGLGGKQFQDDVALEDFLPTMSRRVIQLLSTQFGIANANLTAAMVSYYARILRGLSLSSRAEKSKSFLPTSPVKLISSLWSNSHHSLSDAPAGGAKHQRQQSLPPSDSHHSMHGSLKGRDDRPRTAEDRPENPLMRLEQTFTGYIAALQCRKGAIVGRTVLNRSGVDELSVNDLYNRLIESPFDFEAANDLGTDVVFVAFENFLRIAWTGQMGPIMTMQALDTLQERANKKVPGNFADFVNYLFREMAPQNRRAFTAVIKLLADLLDGCGNDSDRGALTLAFAELLVTDGTAPNYINLLDRLVEDCDRIFDDPGANAGLVRGAGPESANSIGRHGRAQTGSMTSNASSLRRKFGLDMLLRQNPKEERPSMWRSLSRHRYPAAGESSSLSRGVTGRTRSSDDCNVAKRIHGRPMSRERPPIAGAFDDAPQRPASSHRLDFPLDTIGEPSGERTGSKPGRRKRRSSLSDLNDFMAAATIEDEPLQPLQATKQTSGKVNASTPVTTPRTTTPSRLPMSPNAAHSLRTPRQKENWADPFSSNPLIVGPPLVRPDSPSKHDSPAKLSFPGRPQETLAKRRGHSKTLSSSSIPMLKAMRPATAGADWSSRPASPTRSGAQKLRLQSPQRIRERLHTDRKAVHEIDVSLQSELSRIGADLARVNSADAEAGSEPVDVRQLAASVKALESSVPAVMRDLVDRQATLHKEMDTILKTSEAKIRAIDQLHKEAVAENELLYEKFNSELGKIVKAVRGRGKDDKEELVTKLKEQGEEMARLKKENTRLKRDTVSLRAALKGIE